jgi:hypothetical protein
MSGLIFGVELESALEFVFRVSPVSVVVHPNERECGVRLSQTFVQV